MKELAFEPFICLRYNMFRYSVQYFGDSGIPKLVCDIVSEKGSTSDNTFIECPERKFLSLNNSYGDTDTSACPRWLYITNNFTFL